VFVIVSTVPWNRVVAGQSPFTLALDEIHFPYASEFMAARSEEHTSELQSPCNLVCRLLLEKKKNYDGPLSAAPAAHGRRRHGHSQGRRCARLVLGPAPAKLGSRRVYLLLRRRRLRRPLSRH